MLSPVEFVAPVSMSADDLAKAVDKPGETDDARVELLSKARPNVMTGEAQSGTMAAVRTFLASSREVLSTP